MGAAQIKLSGRGRRAAGAAALSALAGMVIWALGPADRSLPRAAFEEAYRSALPPLAAQASVYHLGHSLVGRDMPAMLAQMTGGQHQSQLGWGASLRAHWSGDVPGFAEENASPAFRPAHEAVTSGQYAAVVLTEMVELADALRYHDGAQALADWAALARKARPDVRIYLYETWHRLDDPAGWEERIAADRASLWEDGLLRPAMARPGVGVIHVIPAGTVLAAVVRAAESGALPGIAGRGDLFSDDIHLTDLGHYIVALVHYAVLTARSPEGLPIDLQRADGTRAKLPPERAALHALIWSEVRRDPMTGLAP